MGAGFLGVIMLDTQFPRILGDAGNPESFPFEVRVSVMPEISSPEVVRQGCATPEVTARVIEAARELERNGARAIISTCGFLITEQADVAQSVNVPVMLSALSMVPLIGAVTGGRPVGVLTASADSLGEAAISAVGCEADALRIAGMEHLPEFAGTFLTPKADQPNVFDRDRIEEEVCSVAQELVKRTPQIGAVLLECGNLPPYTRAISRACQRPVFSILDAAAMLMRESD